MATKYAKWLAARRGSPTTKTRLDFLLRYRELDDGTWVRQGRQPEWVAQAIQRHNERAAARRGYRTLADIEAHEPPGRRWAHMVQLLLAARGLPEGAVYEVDDYSLAEGCRVGSGWAYHLPRRWLADCLTRRSGLLWAVWAVSRGEPFYADLLVLSEEPLRGVQAQAGERWSRARVIEVTYGRPSPTETTTLLRREGKEAVMGHQGVTMLRALALRLNEWRQQQQEEVTA